MNRGVGELFYVHIGTWTYRLTANDVWYTAAASAAKRRIRRKPQWIDYPMSVQRDWGDAFDYLTKGKWTTT